MGGAGGQVEVVETGAGAHDDLQVLGGFHDGGRHFVGADDQGVGIGDGGDQFGFTGIFFEQGEGMSVLFGDLADAVHGGLRKGFLRSN